MASIKLHGGTGVISRFVNVSSRVSANVILQTTLGGTDYLTSFGGANTRHTVDVWVRDAGKTALESAYVALSLLDVSSSHGSFSGRIAEIEFEDLPAHWYRATLTMTQEAVT